MKYGVTVLGFGLLFSLGCSSSDDTSSGANPISTGGAGAAAPVMSGAGTGAAAGKPAPNLGGAAGTPLVATTGSLGLAGHAGAGTGGVTGTAAVGGGTVLAAGSGAVGALAGSGGSPTVTAGSPAAGSGGGAAAGGAGGGGAPLPVNYQAVYDNAFKMNCPGCHVAGGLFPSLDLSTPALAFTSLVSKPASTDMGNSCAGMGTLVTPGNCDTSLLYQKISQPMPVCGRRMPLGLAPLGQNAIDEVCAWIKAGATMQ
jgi:hypothetical protein